MKEFEFKIKEECYEQNSSKTSGRTYEQDRCSQ